MPIRFKAVSGTIRVIGISFRAIYTTIIRYRLRDKDFSDRLTSLLDAYRLRVSSNMSFVKGATL